MKTNCKNCEYFEYDYLKSYSKYLGYCKRYNDYKVKMTGYFKDVKELISLEGSAAIEDIKTPCWCPLNIAYLRAEIISPASINTLYLQDKLLCFFNHISEKDLSFCFLAYKVSDKVKLICFEKPDKDHFLMKFIQDNCESFFSDFQKFIEFVKA